jgi:hypothetical protein
MKKIDRARSAGPGAPPWHVLLVAIYPTLALLAHNLDQVEPAAALLPLALSVTGAGLLFLLARLWLRDWQRAALVTSLLLALIFSYGHVYSLLKGVTVSGIFLFRHRTLVPLWGILGGIGTWWAVRRQSGLRGLTRLLNAVGLVLVLLPAIQVSTGLWRQWQAWRQAGVSGQAAETAPDAGGQDLPDIYLIILDGYGRADALARAYDYDNSSFVSSLEQIGFYVARCSQSNYAQTELSLSSELNYDYLSALGDGFDPSSTDRAPLWPLIKNSSVRRFLEARGYQTVAFKTGFSWTEWTDADHFLGPQLSRWQLDGFQYMWLQTTMGRLLLDAEALNMLQRPEDLFRARTAYALERLPQLPSLAGPKLVFAHLIIPHPPYVFGPNGEPVSVDPAAPPEVADQGYLDQLTYVNRRMLEILPAVIAASSAPPVIVIQGDHGNGLERMANLSAFYLPGHEDLLYPTITNVNTFRVILAEYFDQELTLLPDRALFSAYDRPYDFRQVQNDCSD